MFPKLDPILHSELRLAVMSILAGVEEADFSYLKKQTGATSGNLSVQIDKLTTAGYITVEKGFKGKMPRTTCKITSAGQEAFKVYVDALKEYLSAGDF
ncbi:MAG: transcriptional regulator [Bacteroidales bacterium]|nr:transcriptional regulator [Bacteroidales bacterium]